MREAWREAWRETDMADRVLFFGISVVAVLLAFHATLGLIG